jgi:hypothetical protein
MTRETVGQRTRSVEGVTYLPFRVNFTLADGRRRRWIRWAPGDWILREQLLREFVARDMRPEHFRERSLRIRLVP